MMNVFLVATAVLAAIANASMMVKMPHHNHPLLEKGWHSMRALKSAGTNQGYLMTTRYSGSMTCSNDPQVIYGISFGTCVVGTDVDGNVLGSKTYTYVSQNDQVINFNVTVFNTPDCSGMSNTISTASPSSTCTPSEADNAGYIVTYSQSSTPWTSFGDGLVTNYYALKPECDASEAPSSFSWLGLNRCIPTDDAVEAGDPASMVINSCSKLLSVTQYQDATCKNFQATISTIFPSCWKNDKDEDDDGTGDDWASDNYQTQFCVGTA